MAAEQQQVETLVVGYDDRATDAIDATTSALNKMGAAAENAGGHIEVLETQVRRQGRTGEQILRQFGDAERLTARLTAVTRQYQRAKDDLEASELSAAQKAEERLVLQAREQIALEKVIAQHERDMAAVRAKIAATDAMARGAAAATAAAGSWAGAMAKVYETAAEATSAVNGTARALQLLNADFQAGRASFAEWIAGARGLETALRGVSAVQKTINDNTGVSRQASTVIPIGALKYQTTGSGASGATRLTLMTGDAEASARRLDDITAAFAAADQALDRYRESLGLVDVAQRKYEAGLAELRDTIRRAGIEEAEGARILAAYTAQHDPAVAKTAALKKEQEQLATSYGRVMAQIDPGIAAQQRYEAALATLRAGAAAAGKSAEELAADERRVAEAMSPAAIAARQQASALQDLEDRLDKTGAAARQAAADQALLDKALAEQRISPERHAALTKALAEQSGAATAAAGSVKLAAHQVTNLSYQIQDLGVQLASGQSPIMAIAQQGPQAVMAVGGLRAAITLLMSPVTLAIAGITALLAAMALIVGRAVQVSAHTRQLTVDIQAMGNASGVTATQLRGIEAQMRQQGVSSDAAYASVRTLAGARGLPAALVGDVVSISRDMAASTGDVAGAVKTLTDALTEGYQGIRKLDDQFNFLTTSERKQIETMARHGDQAGMLSVAVGALHRQFDGLHELSLSPLGAALERVTAAYNRLLDALASQPIVIRGLEGLAWLLEKTSGGIAPTRVEQIAGLRKELGELEAQYARLPEKTEGVQAAHERIILRRIELLQQLSKLEKEEAAAAPKTSTGAPRTAGTSNARSGPPDPAAAKYVEEQAAAYERLSEAMRGNAVQRALAQADLRAEEEIRDRRLRGAAADDIRDVRRKEALLQLTVAVADTIRAAAAEVRGNELLARAYGVSSAAVREAAIHQKALAEVARGTVEPYDQIVDRLRKLDDAQRALQAAQFAAHLKEQTQDAERLAAAWAQGAVAAREATLANEVLAEARRRGLDPRRDGDEIAGLARGVAARDIAQRNAQFAQMATEQRRSVELANAEFALLGQSNAARAQQIAMLQAANDLRDKGANLADAGTQAYIRQAGELARVNALLQEAAQNAANIAQPIGTAFEDVLVGARKASDAIASLGQDLKRIVVRQAITKPAETAVSGLLTQIMAGPVPQQANDNTPRAANDNGLIDRLIGQVNRGLGASETNPMWVQVAGRSAALDIEAMTGNLGTAIPVAVKDAGDLEGIIQAAAQKYGLDANVIKGIIQQESSWNPAARNRTSGAAGLMQIMPANVRAYGMTDAYDPAQNIDVGARILKEHLVRAGGDLDRALSTYSGHVTTSGAAYVAAVKSSAVAYERAGGVAQKVAAIDEKGLQLQLDAIAQQQQAVSTQQALTEAQRAAVDAALGVGTATEEAGAAADRVVKPMTQLEENAISAAEAQAMAANGAGVLATAATGYAGVIGRAASGLWAWVSSLFSSGSPGSGAVAGGGGAMGQLTSFGLQKAGGWALDKAVGGQGLMGTIDMWGAESLGVGSLTYATPSAAVQASELAMLQAANPHLTAAELAAAYQPGAGTAATGVTGGLSAYLGAAGAGAFGGFLGGMIGSAANSKAVGGLSGAALGAGAAGLASYMGLGALGGPIGLGIGAVVGGIMGLIGTQKKSVGPNSAASLGAGYGNTFESRGAVADNGGSTDAVSQVVTSIAQTLNATLNAVGATNTQSRVLPEVQYFEKDRSWYINRGEGNRTQYSDPTALAAALVSETLQAILSDGTTKWAQDGNPIIAQNIQRALQASIGLPVEQLVANIQFASQDFTKAFDGIAKAAPDQFGQQLMAMSVQFVQTQARAAELGVTTDGLAESFSRAATRMFDAARRQLSGLSFVDTTLSAFEGWRQAAMAMQAAGQPVGPTLDLLAKQLGSIMVAVGDDAAAVTKLLEGGAALRALGEDVAATWAEVRAWQVQQKVLQDYATRNMAAQVALGQVSQQAYDLRQLEIAQAQELAAVTDPVLRQALQYTHALERQAAQARSAAEATAALTQSSKSLYDWLSAKLGTSSAGVSTGVAYTNALASYQSDLAKAAANDNDALGRIANSADRLLTAYTALYGSSGATDFWRKIMGEVAGLPAMKAADGYSTIVDAINRLPHAVGGPASGLTMVNDAGPELIRLPTGSLVMTSRASVDLMRRVAGGNTTTTTVVTDNQAVVEALQQVVRAIVLKSEDQQALLQALKATGARQEKALAALRTLLKKAGDAGTLPNAGRAA
ncbi:phage tail length tape measure family protein [Azospirillum thermophilum]|uniref:Transglycosylase SLT domain-containing protein n=1 Tax=Azospirillum thermophilum TaxID=2202148 RepID=A0A2S2D0Q2_9PROT|nr:phage tail length tape measure family protein [Azospirillum thermophilum]AWK90346.1 hypothetical protein DEW08_30490 [Azospirillum thermophilum]